MPTISNAAGLFVRFLQPIIITSSIKYFFDYCQMLVHSDIFDISV